jgi:hypothetical protein
MRRINVAIASPSDTCDARDVVPRLFNRLNDGNLQGFLHPLMWESASIPELGDHPQHVLNDQIIEKADLLVAILWSKLGTPTPTAPSGTVEEIREFIRRKGPRRVMLYFCTRDLPYDIDPAELVRLREFKAAMKSEGLYHEFGKVEQFERDLSQHLLVKVNDLLLGKLAIPELVPQKPASRKAELNKHPDPRLRTLIDFGTSLEEISSGFARRLDEFDAIDGGGRDKFLDLAAHVYSSAANCLDRFLSFSSSGMSPQDKNAVERIVTRLKTLGATADEYVGRPFPQYWIDGRQISDALTAHERFLTQNAAKVR